MKTYFKAVVVSLALVVSGVLVSPSAQTSIQRGYGPTIPAGSGGATAGISSVLTVSTTTAQTTAVITEETLWTYSLPANTLSADGHGVRITAWGSFAANANVKTVRVKFGATTLQPSSDIATAPSGRAWRFVGEVARTGASTQVGSHLLSIAGLAVTQVVATPAENTATAITLAVTGQNGTASAGDIVLNYVMVEFLRAGS